MKFFLIIYLKCQPVCLTSPSSVPHFPFCLSASNTAYHLFMYFGCSLSLFLNQNVSSVQAGIFALFTGIQ